MAVLEGSGRTMMVKASRFLIDARPWTVINDARSIHRRREFPGRLWSGDPRIGGSPSPGTRRLMASFPLDHLFSGRHFWIPQKQSLGARSSR